MQVDRAASAHTVAEQLLASQLVWLAGGTERERAASRSALVEAGVVSTVPLPSEGRSLSNAEWVDLLSERVRSNERTILEVPTDSLNSFPERLALVQNFASHSFVVVHGNPLRSDSSSFRSEDLQPNSIAPNNTDFQAMDVSAITDSGLRVLIDGWDSGQ